jgi:surface protein
VYGDTTLYAVWKNSDAYIQVGQNFNDSIKSLVNWKLNNISSFERADTMSDEIKNSSNTILISLVDSAPIYAWYDSSDGTVYYYSDSETIYLKGSAANMFKGWINVRYIDTRGWNTSGVTNMSYMFNGCSSLTELDVSDFDTANVINMSYMFNGCSSLTELDVSDFDTVNVTNMSYMFNGCSSLTELDVSGFDTVNVTNMSYMFY